MSRFTPCSAVVCILLAFESSSRALALEPWADSTLPVTSGLELWLDASRVREAAAAHGVSLASSGAVDAWYDSSGHRRDARQERKPLAPVLRSGESGLKFDGANDHLRVDGLHGDFESITIVIAGAPFSNPGGFRAFFALTERGRNDYTDGINIDLGAGDGEAFDFINVEGQGAGGQANLLGRKLELGTFHVLALTFAPGEKGVKLRVDGKPAGSRSRVGGRLHIDQAWIGARCYSNAATPPTPTGFLRGEIADVLMFGRALGDEEVASVEAHLVRKHADVLGKKVAGVETAEPILRMLSPGFTVRELPVHLTNVNDLAYAPDGRLIALGYDGRIHALRDTNGDGLEDSVEPYWTGAPFNLPIAMALAPEGLYVTSHGKVSLLRDTDSDGKLDREDVVASGWVAPNLYSGAGVDAMGIALDNQNNLYFGLGCADFTNAYLLKDGKPHYDISSERGTILKVSPDRSRREIVCTGIRFPCTLAFNREGDLFATDQEGETWCPDGNPLDELDHIVPGRYYGFPPRHETYLPNVIDEPPVAAYGPQHQSTCGLVFNEARPGWKSFGPPSWEGDAFVAGFSRGKLWRTRLVKTDGGYVSKTSLVGVASMLLLDMAISPAGDMVVTCHGGAPDWGTGPSGLGKLFKVSYTDPSAPQPVLAWASGPLEARVAFDRPVDGSIVDALRGASITYGEHVRAGDRFEVQRPGYATVEAQLRAPVGELHAAGAKLSDDRRTVIIATDPHPMRATYAMVLPALRAPGSTAEGAEADVAYTLHGVAAAWSSGVAGDSTSWSGWLPHLDPEVSASFTRGSAEHEALEKLLSKPGSLSLRTKLLLPPGKVRLTLISGPLTKIDCRGAEKISDGLKDGRKVLSIDSKGDPLEIRVTISTVGTEGPPRLRVLWSTDADPTQRPIPLDRLFVPWAPDALPAPAALKDPPPELAGGDWKRGEEIFFGPDAKCSACHVVRGKGGKFGPDLSNLVYRDAGSVLRDIADPSAAINPDYVPYTVVLADGRVIPGLVRAESGDKLRVIDSSAKEIVIARGDVSTLEASTVSIMPKGMPELLGPTRMKDLLTFLLYAAPTDAPVREPGTLRIVLTAGPKDHGPGEHDYPEWQKRWLEMLGRIPGVKVDGAWAWPSRAQWEVADIVALYYWNHEWSDEQYRDLDAYLARGGGLVVLHSAVIPEREPLKLAERLGLAWEPGKTKFRHGPQDMKVTAPANDPIVGGMTSLSLSDEIYWPLVGDATKVKVLLEAVEEGAPRPMAWTFEPGKARVFSTLLGHYLTTFDDAAVRGILLRAVGWAGRFPDYWDTFLERASRESETFRGSLVDSTGSKEPRARLLGPAIAEFQRVAAPRLVGHRSLEGFTLSADAIAASIAGKERVDGKKAFQAFAGEWHGLWSESKVDHRWSDTVALEPPLQVNGGGPLLRSWQYAWIGDGYGLNLVATTGLASGKDYILGYVVHVKDADLRAATARVPHVGVFAGEGKLIWITAGDVFLEESYRAAASGAEEYAISGFHYKIADTSLESHEGFQAIYTRDAAKRPAWFQFPLDLKVEARAP